MLRAAARQDWSEKAMTLPTDFERTLTLRLLDELGKDNFFNMLRKTTLFRNLPPEQMPLTTLDEISNSVKLIRLAKNDMLDLRKSRTLYEIISGYVIIYDRALQAGELDGKNVLNPPALLAWRVPGEMLGDFRFAIPDAIIDKITATDDCLLLEIPGDLVHRLARSYPQIYLNIAYNLASKANKTRVRAQILRQPNANCMIARLFLELLEERGYEPVTDEDGKEWKLVNGSFRIEDIAAFLGYEYRGAESGVLALIDEELLAHHQNNNRSGRYICDDAGLREYLAQDKAKKPLKRGARNDARG
ncbi:MAG: hypothetical protein DMF66_07280 [Acidobacteria bacterium]|nr:MAG: hypothetical protein DMF66_07280 [Acidobacteriota bacterium]